MSQVVVRSPFEELEQSNKGRLVPTAVVHFLYCESLAPATAVGLGQIRKGALIDAETTPHESPVSADWPRMTHHSDRSRMAFGWMN